MKQVPDIICINNGLSIINTPKSNQIKKRKGVKAKEY